MARFVANIVHLSLVSHPVSFLLLSLLSLFDLLSFFFVECLVITMSIVFFTLAYGHYSVYHFFVEFVVPFLFQMFFTTSFFKPIPIFYG